MRRSLGRIAFAVLAAGIMGAQFRSEVRLVEVHATVFDGGNRPVDGIPRERFQLLEDGVAQEIKSFEPAAENVSCAILLDTTGSMHEVLGGLKNAVSYLIDEMRPEDSVAIYSFNRSLVKLQEFTTDKIAAKRAITRIRAQGDTALFDAIAAISREIDKRPGKKAIVLFTDGADNASHIVADAAVRSAQRTGVSVYAVAEGLATRDELLTRQLRTLSETTGGLFYKARTGKEVSKVFADIQSELRHVYLLSYTPPSNDANRWRAIQVKISGTKDYRIRGKQGYYP